MSGTQPGGRGDEVIAGLLAAAAAAPDNRDLQLVVARSLLGHARFAEALAIATALLQRDPADGEAVAVVAAAAAGGPGALAVADPATSGAPSPGPGPARTPVTAQGFDWAAAEFDVTGEEIQGLPAPPKDPSVGPFWIEHSGIRLADVGGMTAVKERLEAAFLAPLRNPELRAMYGKSLRDGLLLYGPPGCGKTYLARALAGELGAKFLAVGLADILDMWVGSSERNVHELFVLARREAPVVLFLDEIDALGHKRGSLGTEATRGSVNQLLMELDGVENANDGVFVLAATNQPWEVDPALRRPGRLDRTVLVLPPDEAARAAILRTHLAGRPVDSIDTAAIAKRTDGFSGADLAHVCESAAELALLDSVRTGTARPIRQQDLAQALASVRSSIGPWLEIARNVVQFADSDGAYGELREYLKRTRRL